MTTPSIPASAIVNVTPNVIDAGGTGLDLNGLILTLVDTIPYGTVMGFNNAQDAADFFGPLNPEAAMAEAYFNGFDGSNIKPGTLLFMSYVENVPGVAGYLRSGSLAGMTLAQLQALGTGSLTLSLNGTSYTASSINLSGATSFSNAATIIDAALTNSNGFTDGKVVGAIAGTTMTVSAVVSGTLAVGQALLGVGVTAGTTIVALGTGTGGTGTYTVSVSQTVASTTISAGNARVTYSSQLQAFVITGGTPGAISSVSFASGSLATSLKLTEATGAVRSPGAATDTPAVAMDRAIGITQNFATFSATWLTGESYDVAAMVAFAAWTHSQSNRYLYVMWDTNILPATALGNTTTAGYQIQLADYSGTVPIYSPPTVNSDVNAAQRIAAFVMGSVASLDFNQTEGRTNLDLRSQAGLPVGVTAATVRNTLIANGYNFYGTFGTANDEFTFFNPGAVTGPFSWVDSYVNQIWMNNGFQLALMVLLTSVRSIPYNSAGYGLIESALLSQVQAAVNFGAIRSGVSLSALQAAQVNSAAGFNISDTLEQRGWYIQVKDATAEVRAARGSPPVTFWYTDGQSVQSINLASVEIQ